MVKRLFLLLAFMPAFASAANEAEPKTPAAAQKPVLLKKIVLFPGGSPYPKAVADKGMQGVVTVQFIIDAEGKATEVKIVNSSRAKELDELAVNYVGKLSFKVKNSVMPPMVWIPIEFEKDSPDAMLQKTCSDFNVDYAYFKNIHPEKTTSEMPVFELASGFLYLTLPPGQVVKIAKHREEATQATIVLCAERPEEKFYESYLRSAKAVIAQ